LSEIEANLTRLVKDKESGAAVHCQSGARSGAAKKKLIASAAPNVFNMGSYARAERIVTGNYRAEKTDAEEDAQHSKDRPWQKRYARQPPSGR